MNQSLKSKRDELMQTKDRNNNPDIFHPPSWDAAIQAVIELLGEFDENKTIAHFNKIDGVDGFYEEETAIIFSHWQHSEILKMLTEGEGT